MSILRAVAQPEESAPPVRLRLAVSDQQRVDQIAADVRREPGSRIRREIPAKPKPIEQSSQLIKRRLGEEIDYAKRLLKATGDELVSDNICVVRHARMLQSFDIIEQMLGHLATVASAEEPCEAISRIGMTDLRGRLNRGAIDGETPCGSI